MVDKITGPISELQLIDKTNEIIDNLGSEISTIKVNGTALTPVNKTVDIVVPTSTTQLTNDSGFITGITSGDVTEALGYTPYNSSNPDGYITGITSSDVTTALGYTPYDGSTNPNGYITASALSGYEQTSNKTTVIASSSTDSQYPSAKAVYTATNANATAISTINGKIPSAATSTNQLADKDFVNSSIATNTANFIGTFQSVAELEAYSGTLTNNDYAFVETTDTAGNTLYDRYKYNSSTQEWAFEYELNNSSFTAAQWAAINSGCTTSTASLAASALQSGDNVSSLNNDAGYITGITSGDVTTALGYTPYDSSNPNGYISGITSSMVTTALGHTPVYLDTNQSITGEKTFIGDKRIKFKQSSTSNKLGFTLYNTSNAELGGLELRPNTVDSKPILTLNSPGASSSTAVDTYVGFRYWSNNKNFLIPLPANINSNLSSTTNFYIPLAVKSGNTVVKTNTDGTIDISSLIPGSSDAANVYSATNPALTSSDDICTWTITHNLGNNVEVHVYDTTTNKEVLATAVLTSSSVATVELFSTSNLASGAFKAVVIGK